MYKILLYEVWHYETSIRRELQEEEEEEEGNGVTVGENIKSWTT